MGGWLGPFVTACVFLLGQLIVLLIWGAQLEIRMRNVEKVCEKIGGMGTDVTRLKDAMETVKDTTAKFDTKLDRILEQRSFRPSQRPRPKARPKTA